MSLIFSHSHGEQEFLNERFTLFTLYFFVRLILAMDPRYGEISRAMRNRGVEIFMLGEVCLEEMRC